ncbi:hypothetical protein RND81_01G146000 [Saponaria officinalis]|uniref:Uncharacterized protein n=1 Tax=Saponaria officinalis TaxID=3572 RepID=A0AAW1N7M7_SAPOF
MDIDDDDENDGGYQETREGDNTEIGPPFPYDNNVPHTREYVLTPPSSDDGDGDDDRGRGDGGYMHSYSVQSTADFDVPPFGYDVPPPGFTRLTPDAPLERAHQVYECVRKGKNVVNDPPTNEYSWQRLSGNAVPNESIGSNIDPYFSYYPKFEPPTYQPSSGYDTTSNSQRVNIYNHDNINYEDTHYHNPSFYGFDTNLARSRREGPSNPNDSTWGFNVEAFFNGTKIKNTIMKDCNNLVTHFGCNIP